MDQVEGEDGARRAWRANARTLDAWMALRRGSDERLLDIARSIGVSEAELVASACGARADVESRRLREDWPVLLDTRPALGPGHAISQNEGAVLEVAGRYEDVDAPRSTVPSGRIDVRFSLDRLKFGFVLTERSAQGARQSVQLFDDRGGSIHEVVLSQPAMARALDPLVDECRAGQVALARRAPRRGQPGASFDVAAMRAAWRDLKIPRD